MKRPGLTLVVPPAMLFVLTGLRAADATVAPTPSALAAAVQIQRAPDSPLPPEHLTPEEILRRFDRNGDGKLDDEERAEAHEAIMKAQARRPDEAVALRNAMREQILRRFDHNGDGKIDDAEWAELAPILRARIEGNPRQLQRWDRNGDGKLDDAEWAAATVQIRRWLGQPATENKG